MCTLELSPALAAFIPCLLNSHVDKVMLSQLLAHPQHSLPASIQPVSEVILPPDISVSSATSATTATALVLLNTALCCVTLLCLSRLQNHQQLGGHQQ